MRALERTTRLDVTKDVPEAPVALQALNERKQQNLAEQREVGWVRRPTNRRSARRS